MNNKYYTSFQPSVFCIVFTLDSVMMSELNYTWEQISLFGCNDIGYINYSQICTVLS